MLRVIEYFAKSLTVNVNDAPEQGTCRFLLLFHYNNVYLLPFLRYSTENNGVTLKSCLEVIKGHTIRQTTYEFLLAFYINYQLFSAANFLLKRNRRRDQIKELVTTMALVGLSCIISETKRDSYRKSQFLGEHTTLRSPHVVGNPTFSRLGGTWVDDGRRGWYEFQLSVQRTH